MMTNVSNDTVTLIIRCVDTGYYKHDQNVAIQGCCGGCLESDRWPRRIDRGLPRTNPEEGGEHPRTVHSTPLSLVLDPWETRGAVYGEGRKSEKGWTGGSLLWVGLCLPADRARRGSWKGGLLSTNLFPYPITRPSRNIPNRARVGKEQSHGKLDLSTRDGRGG